MKLLVVVIALIFAPLARAQSTITSMTLGPDQIGTIKTTPSITTRIVFPDTVQEIVCGDLYDASTGRGTFVLQRGGTDQKPGNDVFLKPIASKGKSNLFVKVGENAVYTFNFVLTVVNADQAHLAVNVAAPESSNPQNVSSPNTNGSLNSEDLEKRRQEIEQAARQEADEILRNARQQANRITAEADARVIESDRQAVTRSEQIIEDRFTQALLLGLKETRISNPRVSLKRILVAVDSRVLTLDGKSYLRYTITNNDAKDFLFAPVSLETGSDRETQPVTIRVSQSKVENKLAPGESLTGVIIFESKSLASKERLAFYVRADDGSEVARISIQ